MRFRWIYESVERGRWEEARTIISLNAEKIAGVLPWTSITPVNNTRTVYLRNRWLKVCTWLERNAESLPTVYRSSRQADWVGRRVETIFHGVKIWKRIINHIDVVVAIIEYRVEPASAGGMTRRLLGAGVPCRSLNLSSIFGPLHTVAKTNSAVLFQVWQIARKCTPLTRAFGHAPSHAIS